MADFFPCSLSVRILSPLGDRVLFLVVLLSCIIMLQFSARGVLCFSARSFLQFSASSLYGFFELLELSNINSTDKSAFIFSTDLQVSFFLHVRDCFTDSCRIFIIQFCEIRITSVAVSLLICQSGDLCIENLLKTGKVFCISDIRWQNSIKARLIYNHTNAQQGIKSDFFFVFACVWLSSHIEALKILLLSLQ